MVGDHDIVDNYKHIADAKTALITAVSTSQQVVEQATREQAHPAQLMPPRPFGRWYMRPSVLIPLLGVFLFLVGGTLAWLYFGQRAQDVTVYQTRVSAVERYIGGSGSIYPLQELNISYPAVERVLSVYVKPGDEVSPNQSLVQLDVTQLNAQVKQAADDVAAAQNYLHSVYGSNSLTVDQAQRSYDMAVARYNSLVAQASSPTLHHGMLVSPLKGVVTHVNIDPGEVAAANAPLITLVVESTVVAHVQIPLSNMNQVYVGQSAMITPSVLPNVNLRGTVSTIIPQATSGGDTFEIWVNIENTKKELLPGMNTFVRLLEPVHAIVVPRLAVLNPDQGATVFVVRQGHAYLRHIQIGGYADDSIIVDAGLSAGDLVVLTGADTLQDGQAVHVLATEKSR